MAHDDEMTLRDIAQRAVDRNGGKGGRALDRVAKAKGLTLSYTTIDKILAGNYRSIPKRTTLDALADLAALDRAVVYRAAGVPAPQARLADILPPDADLLTPPQRQAVLSVVRQFAAANRLAHNLHGLQLHPNWEDSEDIEDYRESTTDDELRARRRARGVNEETGDTSSEEVVNLMRLLEARVREQRQESVAAFDSPGTIEEEQEASDTP